MRKVFYSVLCALFTVLCATGANAATARPAMIKQQVMPSAIHGITTDKSSAQPIVVQPLIPAPERIDMREKEREACMRNNFGAGNTFVWASKYSNTNNYATMVEDVENPENNICWVKVEIKSADSKISVSDIAPKYFAMGDGITCGSWVDANMMRQRILDARRSGRTWGTIAGAVGGAGVGVGAMELFGNRLIGGAVMGQKELEGMALLRSQYLTAKEKREPVYNDIRNLLDELERECDNWAGNAADLPAACDEYRPLFNL